MAVALRTDEAYQPATSAATAERPYLMTDATFPAPRTERFRHNIKLNDIVIESDQPELPTSLLQSIARLREIEGFEAGWDSYSGKPVESRAFRVVVDLVLESFRVCRMPRIHPNAAGGIDLFWEENERALEMSVAAPDQIELLYEDRARGIEEEPEDSINLDEAKRYLRRYCSAR